MSDVIVATVEMLGVTAVHIAHPTRQGRLGRFDEQMVVVRHQTVGQELPRTSLPDPLKLAKEHSPIVVVDEDPSATIAARHDMVSSAWKLGTEGARHGG